MTIKVKTIMTVDELATYLRMRPITIYKKARMGMIPGFHVGSSRRFRKTTIDQWIEKMEKDNMK